MVVVGGGDPGGRVGGIGGVVGPGDGGAGLVAPGGVVRAVETRVRVGVRVDAGGD